MNKTLLPILLILTSLGCRRLSNSEVLRHRAIDTVEKYLSKNLKDPRSYNDLGYGKLKPIKDLILGKDTIGGGGYTIQHLFRAKNEFGIVVRYDQKFILSRNLEVNEVRDMPDN